MNWDYISGFTDGERILCVFIIRNLVKIELVVFNLDLLRIKRRHQEFFLDFLRSRYDKLLLVEHKFRRDELTYDQNEFVLYTNLKAINRRGIDLGQASV